MTEPRGWNRKCPSEVLSYHEAVLHYDPRVLLGQELLDNCYVCSIVTSDDKYATTQSQLKANKLNLSKVGATATDSDDKELKSVTKFLGGDGFLPTAANS